MPTKSRVKEIKTRLLFRNHGHEHKPAFEEMVKRTREETTTISTEAVDFTVPHTAKTKQAWRYAGNKIVRHFDTNINGTEYTDPKETGEKLPRRKHESNFFITINSNKPFDAKSREYMNSGAEAMATSAMEYMLTELRSDQKLAQCIKFGPKDKAYINDKYFDVIEQVDWSAAIEKGDNMHRLHCHIWVTIKHYSQIQINVQMLQHVAKSCYNSYFGLMNPMILTNGVNGYEGKNLTQKMTDLPYVHVKLLPQSDWTTVMKQYIHKGMISSGGATAQEGAPQTMSVPC